MGVCVSRTRGPHHVHHREPSLVALQLQTAELLLLLLVIVAGLVTLARRLNTPYPVLLLIGESALGAIPNAPRLEEARMEA